MSDEGAADPGAKEGGSALPAPCPICRRPARAAFRPFCSQRCADIDLGRWLGERYVIPGPEEPEADPGGSVRD